MHWMLVIKKTENLWQISCIYLYLFTILQTKLFFHAAKSRSFSLRWSRDVKFSRCLLFFFLVKFANRFCNSTTNIKVLGLVITGKRICTRYNYCVLQLLRGKDQWQFKKESYVTIACTYRSFSSVTRFPETLITKML